MTLKKRLLPVLASVSLFAVACGGAAETQTTSAESTDSLAALGEAVGVDSEIAESSAAPQDAETRDSERIDVGQDEGLDQVAGIDVLAVATQSVEDTSYSFEQGMRMEIDVAGQSLVIGADEPFITGQVDGSESAINADIGSFMLSAFESMGLDADDPVTEGLFGDLGSLEMDVWATEDTVVMDLSEFSNVIGALDPSSSELDVFANGPVSVDLDRLAELDGNANIGASDLASQFGSAPITDPADLVTALSSIDELDEAGTDSVNGFDVDVYTADVSLSDYSEALGQDGLGSLDDLGLGDIADSFEEVEVDIVLMVDADGLVRQIVSTIDMGSLVSDLAAAEGNTTFSGEQTMIIETWQTFDNYGDDFDVTPPEAVDVTSELAGQVDS